MVKTHWPWRRGYFSFAHSWKTFLKIRIYILLFMCYSKNCIQSNSVISFLICISFILHLVFKYIILYNNSFAWEVKQLII
jgi:hypothetical protein